MRTIWIKGPREEVISLDSKNGRVTPITGKNGGTVVKQPVMKVLIPREA